MIYIETTSKRRPWPPILGLFKSVVVVVALTYMRRNRIQAELAEAYGGVPADDSIAG